MKEFENIEDFKNVIKNTNLLVLFFTASWCGPCKQMYPFVEQLSESLNMCKFYKIDVDEDKNEELLTQFEVKAMPTFYIIENKKVVDTFVGADKNRLKETLKTIVSKYPNEDSENNNNININNNTEQKIDINMYKKVLVQNYINMLNISPNVLIIDAYNKLIDDTKNKSLETNTNHLQTQKTLEENIIDGKNVNQSKDGNEPLEPIPNSNNDNNLAFI
jgi:thioredoxin-like negative regulator of GroEL